MLASIRDCIDNLPAEDFEHFYQDYVMEVQDTIMNHRIGVDSLKFTSLDQIGSVLIGLNQMTEELKTIC